MKRSHTSLLLLVCAAFSSSKSAQAASGEVYKRIAGCDYFVVSSAKGYALLEWYGGADPDSGARVHGAFEAYGMHTLLVNDDDEDQTMDVWVEDFQLTRTEALEKLIDSCD